MYPRRRTAPDERTGRHVDHDVSDTKEVERMAALYDEDGTRAVEPGAEVETGRNLVRRCGNELGIAT